MSLFVEISIVIASLAVVAIAVAMEEVETPVHAAVSASRGMRSFAAAFLERLSNRFVPGRPATNGATNGGSTHEDSAGQ